MSTTTQLIEWNDIVSPFVTVAKGESMQQIIILDTTIPETTLTFLLDGVRAQLDCVILILADNVSIPLNIHIIHKAPHTRSKVMVRSVARNHARVMINGVLQCMEGADESTAHFSHHALHLSNDVQTRTIPSLEIKADGVDAKHEVSVGYFDQLAVWYGQTRGVSRETMIAEMAKGFVIKDAETLFAGQNISSALSRIATFMTPA